ncbi:MAG: TIGR00266 family protein [Synechocystis sp.]|nr:TIGR00266 family protein [Synechocystis sp.]
MEENQEEKQQNSFETNYAKHLFVRPKESSEKEDGSRPINDDYNVAYRITKDQVYATLDLELKPNQIVFVDANAVTAMDAEILFVNKLRGGLLEILRKALGLDALFLNQFSASQHPGYLHLSPPLPGDICHYFLTREKGIYLKSDHFLACQPTVKIDTNFRSMKHFYNDNQTFLLRLVGAGDLWFSVYGGLLEIPLNGSFLYNPDYIVAFEDTLDYEMKKSEKLSTDKLRGDGWGGQGRLCQFSGEGRVWIQARQPNSFLNYAQSILLSLRFPRIR